MYNTTVDHMCNVKENNHSINTTKEEDLKFIQDIEGISVLIASVTVVIVVYIILD